jgi:hypothetical protein
MEATETKAALMEAIETKAAPKRKRTTKKTPAKRGSVTVTEIGGEVPTNGAEAVLTKPVSVEVTIQGTADMLFHRWNVEEVEARAGAGKGSKVKKTDNPETMVYRDDRNNVCLPGEYLRQSIIHAAKSHQDPRSPRKSLMDMAKATIVCLTPLASLGMTQWDYEDKRRVNIQRNAVTRTRPAIKAGWKATFIIRLLRPQYIDPKLLLQLLVDAGVLVGVADFRPTYGRFQVVRFEEL